MFLPPAFDQISNAERTCDPPMETPKTREPEAV